jgi:hypothetical protein
MATATKLAATRPRHRVTSIRSWASASSAGTRVRALIIVNSTVTDAPRPTPATSGMPMSNMPSSEITTVIPAKVTARPAVFIAVSVAARGGIPARVPSR